MEAATQTTEKSTEVTTLPVRRPTEIRVVNDPIAVLDTARFEHMQRIATVMAASNLIPESLCMEGAGDNKQLLAPQQITANCFLVVNQAVRWNMDPFAVAQCVSVIHGKLCYEGKLIAGVIEAKLGIRLKYTWTGDGDGMRIVVSGHFPNEAEPRTIEGSVADWKTEGKGTPWIPKRYKMMLAYRGSREWGRLHSPGLMLGVYSDDELSDMADDARGNRARDVTPRPKAPDPDTAPAAPDPDAHAAEAPRSSPAPKAPDPDAETHHAAAPAANTANWRDQTMKALTECSGAQALDELRAKVINPAKETVSPEDFQAVAYAYKQAFDRISMIGP